MMKKERKEGNVRVKKMGSMIRYLPDKSRHILLSYNFFPSKRHVDAICAQVVSFHDSHLHKLNTTLLPLLLPVEPRSQIRIPNRALHDGDFGPNLTISTSLPNDTNA